MADFLYKDAKVVNNRYYDIPKFAKKNYDFSDVPGKEFVIQAGERLDQLAEQLYNDPHLWRALALYNQIEWFFLPAGTIIKLPNDIQKVLDKL